MAALATSSTESSMVSANLREPASLHAYLVGLRKQSAYNFHAVEIKPASLYLDNEAQSHIRISVRMLSSGKRLSVKIENLKIFEIVEFAENSESLRQIPAPRQISLPGTVSQVEIWDLVENGMNLPQGMGKHISQFLLVSEISHKNVEASACSSSSNQHPISEVLNSRETTWWISNGHCPQWVEFRVENPTFLKQICIKIPKLPFGPLSVRSFKISYLADSDDGDEFIEDDRIFETLDTDRFQVFAVDPPIMLLGKSPKFRIVCLSTAQPEQPAVGYFSIRFA